MLTNLSGSLKITANVILCCTNPLVHEQKPIYAEKRHYPDPTQTKNADPP
jgi:hypothetical protein